MALTKVTFSMIEGAVVNVLNYGADNTGATNCASAVQTAIAASAGKTLYFPDGTYLINSPVTGTVDNITIDFGTATITNTVALPIIVVDGLSINPIIYLQGDNTTVKNGLFSSLVSQGIRLEGTSTGANPYREAGYIKSPIASGLKFYNCIAGYLNFRYFLQGLIENIIATTDDTPTPADTNISMGASYGSGCIVQNCLLDDHLSGKTVYGLYVADLQYVNCDINPLRKQSGSQPSYFMAYCINSSVVNCKGYIYGDASSSSPSCLKIDRGSDIIIANCDFFADSNGTFGYVFSAAQFQGTNGFTVVGNRLKARNAGRSALTIYPHTDMNSTGGTVTGNFIENTEQSVAAGSTEGAVIYADFSTGFPRKPLSITGNQIINGTIYVQQAIDLMLSGNEIVTAKDAPATYASIYCKNIVSGVISNNYVYNKDSTVAAKIGVYASGSFVTVNNNTVQFAFASPPIVGTLAYRGDTSSVCTLGVNSFINAATKYSAGTGWTVLDYIP